MKLCAIGGVAVGRFPQPRFHNRKAAGHREFVDQLGDILCGWIVFHQKQRFAKSLQHLNHRITLAKQHPVIEILVNPACNHAFEVRKIEDHPAIIERWRFERNDDSPVMPVQMFAFAIVIQQTMAVTKVDLTRNAKHGGNTQAKYKKT